MIEQALLSNRVVLSVIGPHAGENMSTIFARKIADIDVTGQTFWLQGSVRPQKVQMFSPEYVLFLEPSSKNGARPTIDVTQAKEFSKDKQIWCLFPANLSMVTGRAKFALVLSALTLCENGISLDLWGYCSNSGAIRFKLGSSTVLAEKKDSSTDPSRMVSRFRRVAAVGKCSELGAVWVK